AAGGLPALSARRVSPEGMLVYGCAVLVTVFMLLPVYLISLAAFSPRAAIFDYPRTLWPTSLSAESLAFFVRFPGVLPALGRSLAVGVLTVVLSLLLGCPAGYAIARHSFRGRDVLQLLLVNTRAVPLIIISI